MTSEISDAFDHPEARLGVAGNPPDRISLRELSSLAQHAQFSEGRALAALYLVRDLLTQRGEYQA